MKFIFDKLKKIIVYLLMKVNVKLAIKLIYLYRYSKILNLKNPMTFNEKLQYLKLNYYNELYYIYVDKIKVREYLVSKKLSNILTKCYYTGKNITEYTWNSLPKQFVIKANHSSGDVLIIKNKDLYNIKNVNKTIQKWLSRDYSALNGELFYKNIDRKIIIEELLIDENGNIPMDFKVHCFSGNPKIIQVDIDRFGEHKRNFYDLKWELQEFSILHPREVNKLILKPIMLKDLIEISKLLSNKLPYCRIDLYFVDNSIKFGEITLIHGSGFEKIIPEKYQLELGKLIEMEKVYNEKD